MRILSTLRPVLAFGPCSCAPSEVAKRKKTVDRSVADGRAYVGAYVDHGHYVERLHQLPAEPRRAWGRDALVALPASPPVRTVFCLATDAANDCTPSTPAPPCSPVVAFFKPRQSPRLPSVPTV